MKTADVLVVGVGAIGAATAYQLARKGLSVIGIDRFEPPHEFGSSAGETRMIRKAYFEDPRYIPLLQRSYTLWGEIEAASGSAIYTPAGLLIISRAGNTTAQKAEVNAKTHGIALESLDSQEIGDRFPVFHVSQEHQGLFEPDAGYLHVDNALRAQISLARKSGASFQFSETVTDWSVQGDIVSVVTDRNRYQARSLILAPGAWSPTLLRGLKMPLRVTRAPLFWVQGDERHTLTKGMPCFAFSEQASFVYGFPALHRGVKVAAYAPSDAVLDPLQKGSDYRAHEWEPVRSAVERFLPGVELTPRHWHICLYTLSADENFIVDNHPDYPNVFLASGDSGHAFKFIPVLGEILTHRVLGEKLPWDLSFLKCR